MYIFLFSWLFYGTLYMQVHSWLAIVKISDVDLIDFILYIHSTADMF